MNYNYYGNDYGVNNLAGGLLAGYIVGLIIGSLIVCVFGIIVMWKIFVKAGKPGWAALVPFYNGYVLFEITWGKGWMFLTMFAAIIPIIGYIAVLVILVLTMLKLAKAFGKDTGFAVGLILLSLIFMAILAFDSSTYLGVPTKEGVSPQPQPSPTPTPTMNTEQNTMVSQPQQPVNPTTGSCPNCGTQLQPGTEFCPNCGNKVTN